jgi:hypothetical protein
VVEEPVTEEEVAEAEEVEVEEVVPEMALAIREERSIAAPPASSLPSEREWKATIAVATEISNTPFVPESYRGKPEAVVAAILTGRELGIGPMQSLRDIYMIDGRPVFSASLMLAQMRKRGLVVLESESTLDRAWIRAQRSDTGEVAEVEWTYAEGEQITRRGKKLVDGDNWRNYRADMLWARAVGRLARRLGSDLLGGMVYSSEELRDLDGEPEGDYAASTAPPAVTWETLAPGAQLHPDAPKGWKEIDESLRYVHAGLEWKDVVAAIFLEAYGVAAVADLGEKTQEAGRRLANMAGYLREVVQEGKEFPPPSDDEVVRAIAWAFDGAVVELPEPAVVEEEPVEEGEFVDASSDVCRCGHEPEEHDPAPDDMPEGYGACSACDTCAEYVRAVAPEQIGFGDV